ncbi:MAG: hypothetical protein F2597_04725 [Actinobacteria bacterium]|nr:hypothetical protein [Actinomycetota bacterium]MSY25080.1 hypothetical protein [Actinomycetota bacterium]MSZ52016.1 hypothetical protein [Actinomycetota bacterium]MTA43130.1 hypothetical protein [Actinomycetota bacterium]MTB22188.1 hypothetical protein [Actinomycetota bacterium]
MTYSSALFSSPSLTLEEGSIAKLDRLCRMIDICPGDRVLEIGTGWGGFAIHAATRFGAHVTTTTRRTSSRVVACRRSRRSTDQSSELRISASTRTLDSVLITPRRSVVGV